MGEKYRGRKIPEAGHAFRDETLNDLLFGLSDVTLMNAGLTKRVQKNWIGSMMANRLPTLNMYGQEAVFGSWEVFEQHVAFFFEQKKKKQGIIRGMRRLRGE